MPMGSGNHPAPDPNLALLSNALKKRKKAKADAIAYARTPEAARERGEMGFNPSGTQGAVGTEAAFMNPAVYKTERRKKK